MANDIPDLMVVNYKGSGNVTVHKLLLGTTLEPTQDGNDVLVGNLEAPNATSANSHGNRLVEAFGKRYLLHGFRVYERDSGGLGIWGEVTGLALSVNDVGHSGLHLLHVAGVPTLAFLCEIANNLHAVHTTDGVNWTDTDTGLTMNNPTSIGASVVFRESIFWTVTGNALNDRIKSYDFLLADPTTFFLPTANSGPIGGDSWHIHQGELFWIYRIPTDKPTIWRLDGASFTVLIQVFAGGFIHDASVQAMFSDGQDLIALLNNDGSNLTQAFRVSDVLSGGSPSVVDISSTVLSGFPTTSPAGFFPFVSTDPDPSTAEQRVYFWWRDGNHNSDTFDLFRFNYRQITHGAETAAPYLLGEVVTQSGTGAFGTVVEVGAGFLALTDVGGPAPFDNTGTLTGADSGNTAPATSLLVEQAATSLGSGILGSNFGLPVVVTGGLERIPVKGNGRPTINGAATEVLGARTRWPFAIEGVGADLNLEVFFNTNSEAPDVPFALASSSITLVDTPVTTGLIGNLGEVALEALTPTAGDAYVVSNTDGDAILNPGTVSITDGDIVEFDGANWANKSSGNLPLFKDLEGYWHLNSNGTDSSGNGLTLTENGSPTYAAGIFNNGFDAPGVNSVSLSRASVPTLDIGLDAGNGKFTPFSVQMWIDPDTLVGTTVVVGKGDQTFDGWRVDSFSNGALQLTATGRHAGPSSGAGSITIAGGLHHVVFTSDGLTWRVYVNGVELGSNTQGFNATASSDPIRIGNRLENNQPFDGVIDEVAIWSRALSAAEVTALYNAGAGKQLQHFGFPVKTTHATLNATTALIAPYTDGVDEGKVVAFDGTSLDGILLAVPTNDTSTISGVTPSNGASSWTIEVESGTAGLTKGQHYSVSMDVA